MDLSYLSRLFYLLLLFVSPSLVPMMAICKVLLCLGRELIFLIFVANTDRNENNHCRIRVSF